jgi:hypothetical protein
MALSLPERTALAKEYASDPLVTLAQIGDRFGVTKERARQWIAEVDPKAADKHRKAQVRWRKRQADAMLAERRADLARNWERRILCAVCLGPRPSGRLKTCSHHCADLWKLAGYNIDPTRRDNHQRAVARHRLEYPERHTMAEVDWADRYLTGEASSHGRWVLSLAQAEALKEVERLRTKMRRKWGSPPVDATAS